MNESWLKDGIKQIVDLSGPTTLSVGDRTWVWNPREGTTKEVIPPYVGLGSTVVGSIDALVTLVKRFASRETCVITVGPARISAEINAYKDERHGTKTISIPYLYDDVAPSGFMTLDAFLEYLEEHTGHIGTEGTVGGSTEDAIMLTLRTIQAYNYQDLTVTAQGPAIQVDTLTKKGIVGAGGKLPKTLCIYHRYGVREFWATHRYKLSVSTATKGEIMFTLTLINKASVSDAFIAWALKEIRAKLNQESVEPSWIVVEGA